MNERIEAIHDEELADEALDRLAGPRFAGCIQSWNSFGPVNGCGS